MIKTNSHMSLPIPISMASTIIQYTASPLPLGIPIHSLRNNFRINHSKVQLSLSLADDPQQSTRSEKIERSRLRVRDIVGKIKALPTNNRSNVIAAWVQSTDLGTVSECNDLLMALLRAGESELALKLFDEMPSRGLVPDSWTLSICIRCHCKDEDFDKAERVLSRMLEIGLRPNHASIATLVNSMSIVGYVQRASTVLEATSRVGFRPRVQTYNCLLKGMCYVGMIGEAFKLLAEMKEGPEKPDIFSYTALMNGLCKLGRSDEAFRLLGEAMGLGLKPDVVAFNTLFDGYCREGRAMEGIEILNLMKKRDCIPDHITYTTLLHGLLTWRHTKPAYKVYEEMFGMGIKVEDKMVNALLRGLCWKSCDGLQKYYFEKAHRLFLRLKYSGSTIDPSTYDVVVHTLCVWKRTDEASNDLQSMIRLGFAPRMVTFNGVVRALCLEKNLSEALILLFLLNEYGRVPSRTCYNILIHELNQRGSPFGARTMYGAALKYGVAPSKVLQQWE